MGAHLIPPDAVAALQKTAKRVGTVDRQACELAISEIFRLRGVVVSQGDEIRRLNNELLQREIEAEGLAEEGTLQYFDRYIAGDRK